MSEEGKFFTTLGADALTYIPGGADINGPMKSSQGNYLHLNMDSLPILKGKVLADGTTLARGAPTGAAGDENVLMFPEGTLEWHVIGTQTLLGPRLVATGLDVSQDKVNNDGVEYTGGILASNKLTFVVGTTPAFFARMRFTVADVSGSDECAFGFRKAEAYQDTIDGYDALACLNNISGDINIETITDGGTNVTTDTTMDWADGEEHEFEVRVSAAGVVTYLVDGSPPTTTAAFTFTDAEVLTPMFYHRYDATSPGDIIWLEFECGLQ